MDYEIAYDVAPDVAYEIEVVTTEGPRTPSPMEVVTTEFNEPPADDEDNESVVFLGEFNSASATALEEDKDDVIFVKEVKAPSAKTPCFLPCCYKPRSLRNLVPARPRTRGVSQRPIINRNHRQPSRSLTLFPEPPVSQWPIVNVYHLDPRDGTVRYKCLKCNCIVEERSFRPTSNYLALGRHPGLTQLHHQ